MLKDYNIIEHCFDNNIKIVPISDVHIGASAFMEKEFKETIKYIQDNENVYTILVGDIIDNAITTCKVASAVYDNVLSPMQQVEKAIEYLRPIKDKVLGCVLGNHCYRTAQSTGINPMVLICAELGIQNVYRDNIAIIKIKLGKRDEKPRQTYTLLIAHGIGSENSALKKDKEFVNYFEGIDCIVTGHVHNGKCSQHVKKVVDNHNNNVYDRIVSTIICNSFLGDADYALKNFMVGTPHSMISFDLTKKKNKRIVIHID